MSKRRYHRRSKMKRRGVKNGSQHGSKMAPKWIQNGSKMAPWRPLGGPWARPCCQTLWHGPGRPQKFILAALERPWSEKWIDFGLLESPRDGPGGGLGGHLGELFGGWAGGNEKKAEKSQKSLFFWSCFCMRFLTAPVCVLFASALAGAKAQLKNLLNNFGVYHIICECAVCARSAKTIQTERKSNRTPIKKHTKNTMPRKLDKSSRKHSFGSQHASKNRPRSPPKRSGRLLRASSAPKALREPKNFRRAQDGPKRIVDDYSKNEPQTRSVRPRWRAHPPPHSPRSLNEKP